MVFLLLHRHSYPLPSPPHPPPPHLSPAGDVNKLGLCRPLRSPPTPALPNHCYPLWLPCPLTLCCCRRRHCCSCSWKVPGRCSDDPLGRCEPLRPHSPRQGRLTSVSVRESLGVLRAPCEARPPAKPGRKLGLSLYFSNPWDALPSQWWRWVREIQLFCVCVHTPPIKVHISRNTHTNNLGIMTHGATPK